MGTNETHSIWELVKSGGFVMFPLVICSLLVWAVIFERIWQYRRLGQNLVAFHLEATNILLRNDLNTLKTLCGRHAVLPTAKLLTLALERISSQDSRLRSRWAETVENRRQFLNQELKQHLWLLGTIGSAAPFIGLFGTVVGILRSFQEMARSGTGGFTVVAGGISESLIATAAGIVVAVIAVMAFNAFQTRWSQLTLMIRIQTQELTDLLAASVNEKSS